MITAAESTRKYNPVQNRSGFTPRPRGSLCKTATLDGGGAPDVDEILAADADKGYQIYWIGYSNAGDASRTVSLKWGSGDEFMKFKLATEALLVINLLGAELQGAKNTALSGLLDAAGTVYVTVCYRRVEV